ncbi:unnamed protein product, partial [Polarella glacialis]
MNGAFLPGVPDGSTSPPHQEEPKASPVALAVPSDPPPSPTAIAGPSPGRRVPVKLGQLDQDLLVPAQLSRRFTTQLEEAKSTRQSLRKFTQSQAFLLAVAGIIVANAVYMGVEVDADKSETKLIWNVAEVSFSTIFTVELSLRFIGTTPIYMFFADGWNLFDLVLVIVSMVDLAVQAAFDSRTGELDKLSSLRLVRLTRVVRVFRLVRVLKGLWRLVVGIVNASWTLVWTWVLLALVIYIFSIVATRLIGQPHKGNADMDAYFGTMGRSMFTLFQVTTTEGWADIARQSMQLEPWTAGFFILYLHVTTFAILNVMIAVIVENTLDQAGNQRTRFLEKKKMSQRETFQRIYKVFKDGDADKDGVLTKEEFLLEMNREDIKRHLEQIGINVCEAENLFSILDYDGSGSLDAEEFLQGLMK